MKKIFLFLLAIALFLCPGFADAEDAPANKKSVVIYYDVPDTVLMAQNSAETVEAGRAEFENEVKSDFDNRFNVLAVKPMVKDEQGLPNKKAFFTDMPGQTGYYGFKLDVLGSGTQTQVLGNAFGGKKYVNVQTTIMQITEYYGDKDKYAIWVMPLGQTEYHPNAAILGGTLIRNDNPRTIVKNNVKGYLRDLNKFSPPNKFSAPMQYKAYMFMWAADAATVTNLYLQNRPEETKEFLAKCAEQKKADGF